MFYIITQTIKEFKRMHNVFSKAFIWAQQTYQKLGSTIPSRAALLKDSKDKSRMELKCIESFEEKRNHHLLWKAWLTER